MPFTNYGELNKEMLCVRLRTGKDIYDESVYDQANNNLALKGIFTPWVFSNAYDEFCTRPISECLNSDNLIVRLIAYLDKRTGYRTLINLKDSVAESPEWLQFFFQLRIKTYRKE